MLNVNGKEYEVEKLPEGIQLLISEHSGLVSNIHRVKAELFDLEKRAAYLADAISTACRPEKPYDPSDAQEEV